MQKALILAVAAVLLSANVALAEVKIGVVDMQVIATQSDAAKDARNKMESRYGSEKKSLEKQAQDLQKQAESFKDASEDKKMDFLRKKRDFDEKSRNFARKVEQDEMEIRRSMVSLVFKASQEVAQRKGFNYVVDVTSGGVLYAEQNMDLTQDILAEVNKLWKSGYGKDSGSSSKKKK